MKIPEKITYKVEGAIEMKEACDNVSNALNKLIKAVEHLEKLKISFSEEKNKYEKVVKKNVGN